jgi:predicted GH43/DUF377 family glycosyl hydrolase
MKKMHSWLLFALLITCSGSLFFSWLSQQAVSAVSRESKAVYKACFPELIDEIAEEKTLESWSNSLCKSLRNVPYGEDIGTIKSVKRLAIEGVLAPHNASVLSDGEGYILFFRHDCKEKIKVAGFTTPIRQKIPFISKRMPFKTYISAIRLNKNLEQVSPVCNIDTNSCFSEDPRAFRVGEKVYLSYNDMQENELYSRTIRLAEIDPKTLKVEYTLDIDQLIHHVDQKNHVEKNWVPFASKGEDGEEKIFFEYGMNPHKLMRMKSPTSCEMDHLIFPHTVSLQKMPWDSVKWGALRGGTPAVRVNDEQYLAFFHTLFFEGRRPWYAMGAYTFEAKAPYRITSISSAPILFKGIYDTPVKNTAHSKKKAIYPAGVALGQEEGKDVVYVSCGENDCTVKIITFNQEELLKSLKQIPLYQKKL